MENISEAAVLAADLRSEEKATLQSMLARLRTIVGRNGRINGGPLSLAPMAKRIEARRLAHETETRRSLGLE